MKALALTIGNVKYTLPEHRLVNAVNDANDFGGNLLKLGFSVENINNCTAEQFARKIEGFGENLMGQEIGLFYYSGHGFQIENKNFLTGIDTNFYDATSARHTSISLDEIIERMRMASLRIKIIILDTCRDNPFPKTRSAVNLGLAPINAPKGTVVAFSTSPGEKAMDGGSGRNSIYTGALLKHINDPNISIEDFFKRVRTTVSTHTKGKQTSWEHTSLIGEFSFNSGQLVQSIKLPYGPNYVADVNFQSDGSKFGEAIVEMKSNDWYRQGPALSKFRSIKPDQLDQNQSFLFGRNLLQMSLGGEFESVRIMESLDQFLSKYSNGDENHVLNGILFEIYFDSKGLLRQKFKSGMIDDIFKLQSNDKYKKSFDFICSLLRRYKSVVFFLPQNPPKSLSIDVELSDYSIQWPKNKQKGFRVVSIKHDEIELLHNDDEEFSSTFKTSEDFISSLAGALAVPKERLTVTFNKQPKSESLIVYPWELKLSRSVS